MGTNLETSRRNSLQMELRTWQGNMAIDAIPWEVMTSRRWKHVHVEVIWWLMPSLSHSNYVQCEWMNEWSTNSVNQHYDMTLYQSQSVLLHYTYVKKRRVCLCVCVSVCLSVTAMSLQETHTEAWNLDSTFRMIMGVDGPNIFKMCPRDGVVSSCKQG